MIHTTVGVYLNGDYKTNGVESENLESHINYNKVYRFGRALLVDGKVVHLGYYKESEREMLETKYGTLPKETVGTAPYI